jgi:DNA-binding cell septation regulator SpoVG
MKEMKIHNYKLINKGALIAQLDLEFSNFGLTIRECLILNGKNGRFLKLPARQYEKDGVKKYFNLVFFDKERHANIEKDVLDLVDSQTIF